MLNLKLQYLAGNDQPLDLVRPFNECARHLRGDGHILQSGEWGRRERVRLEAELEALLTETLVAQFRAGVSDVRYGEMVDRLVERTLSPGEAVKSLLDG